MAIDRQVLLIELARGIVRANQEQYKEPAEAWTEDELRGAGYINDASSFGTTLAKLGYYIVGHNDPKKNEFDAMNFALKRTFMSGESLTREEAATRMLKNLEKAGHSVKRNIPIRTSN